MKIPIKKYIDDPTLTWEERYARLEAHHKEETSWLISEVKLLEKQIDGDSYERTENYLAGTTEVIVSLAPIRFQVSKQSITTAKDRNMIQPLTDAFRNTVADIVREEWNRANEEAVLKEFDPII